jgi:hypothetical protein
MLSLMDLTQIEVRIPSLSDINDVITDSCKKEVRKHLENILHMIAQGEDLPIDYLKERYLSDVDIKTTLATTKKRITTDEQCRAKVSTGKRCSRRCKQPDTYCGGHLHSRPYGEITEDEEKN